MASENSDPFDGASPGASHLQESDIYDDLLGDQNPNQGTDQSMPDFQEELYPSTSALDNIAMSGFDMESSDARALVEESEAGILPHFVTESYQGFPSKSLSIGTAVPEIKETNRAEPEKSRRSVAFLDGKEPTSNLTPAQNQATNRTEVLIKEENDGDSFDWTSMPDEIISIHDSEDDDDIVMLQPDGRSVAIKKENDERVIEIDSDDEPKIATKYNLGRSILKGRDFKSRRPPLDSTAIRKVQEAYLQKRRLEHGIPEPSLTRGVLSGLGLQNAKRSDLVDAGGSDWMNAEYTPDDKGGRNFRELKKSYHAKVKRGCSSVEDDIEFVKSEKAEKLRLARLKAEYEDARGYSDDDNSDDGLFISTAPITGASHPKRRAADDPNTEAEVVDLRSPKQRKSNKSCKQTQKDVDREQESNMLAGIEDFLRNMNGQEGVKSGKKGRGKSGGKAKARKKDGAKRTKRTPNQIGYLNNSNNLLTSNVYEDADANLDREALPASGFTNKEKALTALVASVPLGTTTKSGMKSSLRHDQVQVRAAGFPSDRVRSTKYTTLTSKAAAFMKERETGAEEHLGGILVGILPFEYPKEEMLTSQT